MVPALTGSLSSFSPVRVLGLLQTSRSTGRLELVRERERASLWLEAGRTVYVRNDGDAVRVGDILVREGNLRREVVELVAAMQQDLPGERLGRMLVESGAISEEQLRNALHAQQRHVLCALLLWRAGSFRFIPHEGLPEEVRVAIGPNADLDSMIQSVLAMAEERQRLEPDDEAA